MIFDLPYADDTLEVMNSFSGEIIAGVVIGFAEGRARVVEGIPGFFPLFKHVIDEDGDWIEATGKTEELYDIQLYDPNLMRFKS